MSSTPTNATASISRPRHASSDATNEITVHIHTQQPNGTRRRGRRSRQHSVASTNDDDEADGQDDEAATDDNLSRLEMLPLPLFHHVMGFALSCTHMSARQPRTSAERDLDEIGLVSTALRVHATEVQGQLALAKMLLWISSGKRKEMLELRRELLLRRLYLRELEVNVFPPTGLTIDQANDWLRSVLADVAAMVSSAPQLDVLDLSACCGDVSSVVRAAATNCLQLQALLLPTDRMDDPHGRAGQSVDMAPLMSALDDGMVQWHRRTGGLRQLRIPSRPSTEAFTTSVAFLQRVNTYCPKIELLDAAVSQWGLEEGMDEWIVDRAAWERFCVASSSLRELDWVTVPWATDFFEIFAKHTKPKLTQLTLKTTMQWDWDTYLEHVGRGEAAAMRVNGIGAAATRVHHVLRACPALKRLTITPNSRVSNDDATLDAMLDLEEYDGRQAPLPFKKENAMNQSLFGDKFCGAMVRHCPLLEEFRLLEDHQSLAASMKRVRPIMRFQDTALQSLAQLQHLSVVDLKAVNITGKGLFDLVNAPANEAHGTRCYDVAIGDERSSSMGKSFYTAMQDFLQCMLQHEGPLLLASKRIYLCVINGNTSAVESQWSETYLSQLKSTIRALKGKYPTVTFRVETDGLMSQEFATIYGFGLYTAGAKQPLDSRWVDIPAEALEDDVFIIEEVMDDFHDDDEHGEDDDEFDDEFDVEEDDEDAWEDASDQDFDSDEDDEDEDDDDDDDDNDDSDTGGRGHAVLRGVRRRRRTFFNGVALPDLASLAINDRGHDNSGDEEGDVDDDHTFDDQDGYDY